MTTTIYSNGSGSARPLEALFERLATHPLDRTFEAFGNFVERDPVNLRGEPMTAPGGASFFGNFHTYSHVFSITTDEPELIECLTAAIRENQQRADYLDQPPPFDRAKLQINRKRFSTTQGECELIYDGRRLGQFGDTITMSARGGYHGASDQCWEGVAHGILSREHAAARELQRQKAEG